MSNYNSQLQSNNTDLQRVLQTLQNKAAGGEQATPVISVNSTNGVITATAGTKSATHQLAFQPAKTITPSSTSQIAVSSGYYTGGNITVAAVPTQTKSVTPKSTTQNITPDSGKFLSKVTVAGDPDLIASNIKSGVSIFGVSGTLEAGGSSGEVVEYSEAEDAIVTGTISAYTNDRVTLVGCYAFYQCSSLTTANFPAAISIGPSAFGYCSSLTTASFPAATSIGLNAFDRCFSLTTVSFPAATTIGSSAFYFCSRLTTASFPAATTIGLNAFYGCFSLTTVSFPAATTIGSSAFNNCSSLTTASFPAATTIGSYAFNRCASLTTANFPAATSIGSAAFYGCSRLTTAYFPSATSIGSAAFDRCFSLTAASFPVATGIGSRAFYQCSSLTTANFPAAISIGPSAFGYCLSLTTVSFPAATTIGSSAFNRCSSLTTASFPAATTIGASAFDGCYRLSGLYLNASSVCTLSNSTAFIYTPYTGYKNYFSGTPYIYVPESLVQAYKTATNWTYFSSYFSAIESLSGNLITFNIEGTEYQAEEGMTWAEWVESEYNTDGYFILNNHICILVNKERKIVQDGKVSKISIITNTSYNLSDYDFPTGGGGDN